MNTMRIVLGLSVLVGAASGTEIQPTWESLAERYQVPDWFVDGKIGVWMHWGISSAVDDNRPNDGSWYGRNHGIVMLNIALKGDGTIPDNQTEYLTAFGDFLKINGEGIYGTRPWKTFGEGPLKVKDGRQGENQAEFSQKDIRFTAKNGVLYAFVLAPPTEDIVIRALATGGLLDREIVGIELLGSAEKITWNRSAVALTIQLPQALPGQIVNGFRIRSE